MLIKPYVISRRSDGLVWSGHPPEHERAWTPINSAWVRFYTMGSATYVLLGLHLEDIAEVVEDALPAEPGSGRERRWHVRINDKHYFVRSETALKALDEARRPFRVEHSDQIVEAIEVEEQ